MRLREIIGETGTTTPKGPMDAEAWRRGERAPPQARPARPGRASRLREEGQRPQEHDVIRRAPRSARAEMAKAEVDQRAAADMLHRLGREDLAGRLLCCAEARRARRGGDGRIWPWRCGSGGCRWCARTRQHAAWFAALDWSDSYRRSCAAIPLPPLPKGCGGRGPPSLKEDNRPKEGSRLPPRTGTRPRRWTARPPFARWWAFAPRPCRCRWRRR